jgi:hypothetical protein
MIVARRSQRQRLEAVNAVADGSRRPSVATSLTIELHVLDALTRDLGPALEQYKR